jgi:hypothetical protein
MIAYVHGPNMAKNKRYLVNEKPSLERFFNYQYIGNHEVLKFKSSSALADLFCVTQAVAIQSCRDNRMVCRRLTKIFIPLNPDRTFFCLLQQRKFKGPIKRITLLE